MAETVEIRLTAKDGTSQVFRTSGQAAQKLGDQVEDAGKRGSKGMRDWGDAASKAGVGLGALLGVTSKLGQAALGESRQIIALDRAYGDQADTIKDLASEMQGLGIASDDAVRISALGAQSLARNYGLTADQISELISRSADLSATTFDQYGNQLQLADVMQRVSGAIRGEGEAAEVLGLALSDSAVAAEAAKRGMDGWSTTMTEAEKAQFRYALLLEQTTGVQGAAATQADTLAGKVNAMKIQVLDAASGFGTFLGPAGESAAVLGDVALAAPLVGGALGKIAGSAKTASIGMKALSIATGPVGLALGLTVASVAAYKFIESSEKQIRSVADAITAVDDYKRALGELAGSGGASVEATQRIAAVADEFERGAARIIAAQDELNTLEADTELDPMGSSEDFLRANIALDDRRAAIEANILSEQEWAAALDQTFTLLASENPLNSGLVHARVNELWAAFDAGTLSADDLAWHLNWLDENVNTAYLSIGEMASQTAAATTTIEGYDAAIQASAISLEEHRDAALANAETTDTFKQQVDAAGISLQNVAANGRTFDDVIIATGQHTDVAAMSLRNMTGANDSLAASLAEVEAAELAVAQAVLAATESYAGMIGTTNALDSAISVVLGGLDTLGSGVEKVEGALRGVVGATGEWGEIDQLLADGRISWDQYNAAVKAADDTTANNWTTQQDLNAILVNQAPLLADLAWQQQQYVAGLADLSAEEQLLALAYMDSAESAKALELQTLALSAANGELGEGGEGFATSIIEGAAAADPILKAMLLDMGLISEGANGTVTVNIPEEGTSELEALNTTLQQLQGTFEVLLNIDVNDDGVIGWVPPELPDAEVKVKVVSDADAVDEMLRWGGVGEGGGATVTVNADTAPADETVMEFVNRVGGIAPPAILVDGNDANVSAILFRLQTVTIPMIDSLVGTVDVNANDNASGVIGNVGSLLSGLDGRVANTYVDTYYRTFNSGTPEPYATGGVVIRGGEVGPEMVTTPSGMRAIMPSDGLYTVPEGSYVSPASATRGQLGGGGGGGLDLRGATIYVVAPSPDIHDALNAQLLSQGRR